MEPIAASSGITPLPRPVIALQGDLSAVLQEGRILSGEVLQTLDGGSVLIGIGRHRVPAESHVELQPGRRFLFQVVTKDGQLSLRLLDGGGKNVDSALLRALRSLAGKELTVGRLLSDLAVLLRESGSAQDGGRLASLSREIGVHVFRPDAAGEELKALLGRSSFAYETTMLAGLVRSGADTVAQALESLAAAIRARLASSPSGATFVAAPELAPILREAIERALGVLTQRRVPEALTPKVLGEITAEFARELLRAVRITKGSTRAELAQLLAAVEPQALLRGREGTLLRALVALQGGLAASLEQQAAATFGADLRDKLMGALLELDAGPVRNAVARTLGGLDVEQLLNVVRREFGEAVHWSFPVSDGEVWTTVHLFVQRRAPREGKGSGGRADERETVRLTVGVDFSHLGPIRADVSVRESTLAVRLLASRPETAQRLRSQAEALERELSAGKWNVLLAVKEAAADEVKVDHLTRDVRFLREHHLMDVEG